MEMLISMSLTQLSQISQVRSQRLLFYNDDLPPMVWLIIYLGCIITIGFGYFFGGPDFCAQGIMCAFFSIWLGITILAILEFAHPYHGMMLIPDDPYRYAIPPYYLKQRSQDANGPDTQRLITFTNQLNVGTSHPEIANWKLKIASGSYTLP